MDQIKGSKGSLIREFAGLTLQDLLFQQWIASTSNFSESIYHFWPESFWGARPAPCISISYQSYHLKLFCCFLDDCCLLDLGKAFLKNRFEYRPNCPKELICRLIGLLLFLMSNGFFDFFISCEQSSIFFEQIGGVLIDVAYLRKIVVNKHPWGDQLYFFLIVITGLVYFLIIGDPIVISNYHPLCFFNSCEDWASALAVADI